MVKNEPAKSNHDTGTHSVRHIPDGLFGGELRRFHPMSKKTHARRHAHTLKITVKHPHRSYEIYKSQGSLSFCVKKVQHAVELRAETDEQVDNTSEEQAQRHDLPLAETVHKHTVDEPRKSVDDAVQGQEDTELGLRDAKFSLHCRNCHSQVFSHKIKESVSHEKHDDSAPLPITILLYGVVHV